MKDKIEKPEDAQEPQKEKLLLTDGIPTIRYVTCPSCNKQRLTKYVLEDGSIQPTSDDTYQSLTGEMRPVDACQPCYTKWERRDVAQIKKRVRVMQRAARDMARDGTYDGTDIEL